MKKLLLKQGKPEINLMSLTASIIIASSIFCGYAHADDVCGEVRGLTVEVPHVVAKEDLRNLIKMVAPQPIQVNGKIVLYKDYLLINEPSMGVHIYDNQDPANPVALGFIEILGNNDFMVRNDVIYANTLNDLVLVSIADLDDVHEVERTLDIYAYNNSQFGNFSTGFKVDYDNEVIIGVKKECVPY